MNTFYSGADIPITITGSENINLDRQDFSICCYVYSDKREIINRSQMKHIAPNKYYTTLSREFTTIMGTGDLTIEISLFDEKNNLVSVGVEQKVLNIKNSLIGKDKQW